MAEWRQTLEARCTAAALDASMREVVQRELDEHLRDRFDDLVQSGATPDHAARTVLGEVPGIDDIRRLARTRPQHGVSSGATRVLAPESPRGSSRFRLAQMPRDLRFAVRVFLKDRTFTAASIITLALCLAANVAVFTIVNAVLLDAVHVPDPTALVQLSNAYPLAGAAAASGGNSGVPDYFDRRTAVPALAEQALFRSQGVSVGDTAAERLIAMTTTPSLFPMLRTSAAIGRTFTDDEGEEGRERKVLLSDALWRVRFGSASNAVGQSLMIGGVPYEIVGVMPAAFRFYDDEVALWLPAAFSAQDRGDESRHSNNWTHVGRLGASATREQAQAQVDALNAANLERFPGMKQALLAAGFHTKTERVIDVLVADLRRPLYFLWGGVACVLLIGVVNLAALTLARSTSRRGEFATRIALGAEPSRVRAQLLTEHLALAATGGVLGAAVGRLLLSYLPALGVALAPPGRVLAFDPRVWGYAAGLTAVVGIALGITAMRAVGTGEASAGLREEGRSRTGSRAARRLRQALVVGQVAIACLLLVGAGVLLTSFQRLMTVDTGFRTSVVTAALALPRQAYPTDPDRLAFLQRLLDEVRALPGVAAAGVTTIIPFSNDRSDSVVWPEDQPIGPGVAFVSPDQVIVSPGYFEAMGMPTVAGRGFDGTDVDGREPAVVVDERLAQRFWPGREAVGRYLMQPLSSDALTAPGPDNILKHRVVGVVRDVKQHALVTPSDLVGTYYFSTGQNVPTGFVLAVQTAAASTRAIADVRRVVAGLDPRLPLFDAKTMQERIDGFLSARRATMSLAVAFGGLALILSSVGLYGVLAYLVAQRTREIGIRMALGGSTRTIAGLVFRESVVVVMAGLVVGIAGAAWLGRLMASEIVGASALEPTAVIAAVALLMASALAATAAPARRAVRVDPAVTLAAE